jgi:hypothetical protein
MPAVVRTPKSTPANFEAPLPARPDPCRAGFGHVGFKAREGFGRTRRILRRSREDHVRRRFVHGSAGSAVQTPAPADRAERIGQLQSPTRRGIAPQLTEGSVKTTRR